jgi:DNA-binding transcriptional ArsR family regulator
MVAPKQPLQHASPLVEDGALSAIFAALADPTRRAIVDRLSQGEATVTALARPFAISLAAVSRHLRVLEEAGLVVRGRRAQWRPARLSRDALGVPLDWLARRRGPPGADPGEG